MKGTMRREFIRPTTQQEALTLIKSSLKDVRNAFSLIDLPREVSLAFFNAVDDLSKNGLVNSDNQEVIGTEMEQLLEKFMEAYGIHFAEQQKLVIEEFIERVIIANICGFTVQFSDVLSFIALTGDHAPVVQRARWQLETQQFQFALDTALSAQEDTDSKE
jgi:hypothetical protein